MHDLGITGKETPIYYVQQGESYDRSECSVAKIDVRAATWAIAISINLVPYPHPRPLSRPKPGTHEPWNPNLFWQHGGESDQARAKSGTCC